ncbi:MAG TPA: hypothetical protein VLA13_10290 [Massilibacterium sp.]|nr:hypothetical protein [Massilibacterium sp.]
MKAKDMQVLDFKAILGMIGTGVTAMITYLQELTESAVDPNLGWWIPLIPAIPTAFYMWLRAWEKYIHIKKGKSQ